MYDLRSIGRNLDELKEIAEQIPCMGKEDCPHCKLLNRLKELRETNEAQVSMLKGRMAMTMDPGLQLPEFEQFSAKLQEFATNEWAKLPKSPELQRMLGEVDKNLGEN